MPDPIILERHCVQVVGSEYRALLAQLATMRQLCDKLKHNNLRRDLDTLQSSLNKYERTSKGLFFGTPCTHKWCSIIFGQVKKQFIIVTTH